MNWKRQNRMFIVGVVCTGRGRDSHVDGAVISGVELKKSFSKLCAYWIYNWFKFEDNASCVRADCCMSNKACEERNITQFRQRRM